MSSGLFKGFLHFHGRMKTFIEDKHSCFIDVDPSLGSAGFPSQSHSSPASVQKLFTGDVSHSGGHSDISLEGGKCRTPGEVFELRCPDDEGNGTRLPFGIHDPSIHPPCHLSTPSCFPDATPSVVAPQPTLFEMPVESVPEMGLGCTWPPRGEELRDAAVCMNSDWKEEQWEEDVFVKEEISEESVCQTRMKKCQPTLDHMGDNLATKGPDTCQVRCSACGAVMLVNRSKLVQMNDTQCVLTGQVLDASEHQFPSTSHGGHPELSDAHEKETSFLRQMVPLTPAGSHPIMLPPGLASPTLPFVQATPTFPTSMCHIPPETLERGWSSNSLPEPCISQFSQTACNVFPDSKALLAETQPKMLLKQNQKPGIYWDSGARKACHCTKSQCLKFYCDCFANGELCIRCNCVNCCNNMEHVHERYKAIKIYLERNPGAFQLKIGNRKWGKVKGRPNMGCSCKRSGCTKNYCECYECVGCKNCEEGSEKTMGVYTRCKNDNILSYKGAPYQYSKCPLARITSDVVKATCGCLIACAEEAEKEGYTLPQAEMMILGEFGQCLMQIIRSIFKPGTS